MSQQNIEFNGIDRDAWVVQRLRELGRGIFDGVTDSDIRRDRIRRAIIAGNLDCVIVGKSKVTGKAETFEQFFERHYNEKLHSGINGK